MFPLNDELTSPFVDLVAVDGTAATTPGGRFSLPVVGGTGRFKNARGQVDFQTLSPTTDFIDTFVLND